MRKRFIFISAIALLLFGAAMRLLPHDPNFTPITTIALIGSLYLGKRWGLVLPVMALFLSDLVIRFYRWQIMLSVYLSFVIIGLMVWISAKNRSVFLVGLSVISSSILFFLITNAAVWYYSPWYEKSFSGLLYSYELGLPFFRNMLSGDIIYTGGLVCIIEVAFALSRLKRQASLQPGVMAKTL